MPGRAKMCEGKIGCITRGSRWWIRQVRRWVLGREYLAMQGYMSPMYITCLEEVDLHGLAGNSYNFVVAMAVQLAIISNVPLNFNP